MELNFYYPNGEKIYTLDEFITFYSKAYYIGQYIEVEKIIDDILEKGIKSESDIIKIIGWKVGAIDMRATYCWNNMKNSPNKKFIYKTKGGTLISEENLIKNNKIIISVNKRPIPVVDVAESIYKNIKKQEKLEEKIPRVDDIGTFFENNWNALFKGINTEGLGPVYRLTILYFFTKGRMPIYDKYADVAVTAIKDDKKPLDEVKCSFAVEGKRKNDMSGIKKEYLDYYKFFEDNNFMTVYLKNRDFDRALWTYGHLFTIVK